MGEFVKDYYFGTHRKQGSPPAQVWGMGWARNNPAGHPNFEFGTQTAAYAAARAADAAAASDAADWESGMTGAMATWFGGLSSDAKEGIWLAAKDYDAMVNP